jgi:Domain of unknown function (DUF3127)
MEIQGKVSQILALQTGAGKNGQWRKQDFILETEGQVSRKICLSLWGEKIDQFSLNTGETVTVFFDLESREYNGRWYTDAKAWKISRPENASSNKQDPQPNSGFTVPDDLMSAPEDDLPF